MVAGAFEKQTFRFIAARRSIRLGPEGPPHTAQPTVRLYREIWANGLSRERTLLRKARRRQDRQLYDAFLAKAGGPAEIAQKLAPVLPYKAPKCAEADAISGNARIGLDSPAKIRASPWRQAVASR